jgi:transposase-like protein
MTFMEFLKKFPTGKAVIDYFVDVRYEGILTCPHCGATSGVYRHRKRVRYCECSSCNNSFSVFRGTIFEDTKLDIRKWFYAINIFLNDKKGVSACNLQRELGGSYRTSWRMLHQIRAAMGHEDTFKVFSKEVEVDETYVGGKPRIGTSRRGRGTSKVPVIGIIERETKQIRAKAVILPNDVGRDLLKLFLIPFVKKVTVEGATVITDDFKGYLSLDDDDENYTHKSVNHSAKEYSDGNGTHTNNVENFWSILKRSIIGVYHKTSPKYLHRYVNEACYRRNNRHNMSAFNRLLKQSVMPQANLAWKVVEGGGWL